MLKKAKYLLVILLFLIISSMNLLSEKPALAPSMAPPESGEMRVHFLDVGQGDSILIELPNNESMLIDGGTRRAGGFVTEYIKALGIDRLDYVVATHPHEDHIGGLPEVFEKVPVGSVYMPKVVHTSQTFETLVETVTDKGHRFKRARAGAVILEDGDLRVDILAPVGEDYEDLNNYSAVIKIEYKNIGVLLMGDAEIQSEREIDSKRLNAQVLKLGHHGSSSSTSPEFLESVTPAYAVISCGEGNDYGHPHPEVMALLESKGVKVFRTDLLGTVILKTDGKGIVFSSDK